MTQSDIGIVGLGTMGSHLARNFSNKKVRTSVYNRSYLKTESFMKEHSSHFLHAEKTLSKFVQSLKTPRKILLMVTAGAPTDAVITSLLPQLQKGDIIIDGGNAHYKDTQRRYTYLKEKGIEFIGCGISGGEEGALNGPSLMPGGSKNAWRKTAPLLKKIAAKDFSGQPCVTHIGQDAAGHYTKMVHNGIEYAIMQMLSVLYEVFRDVYALSPGEISKIFKAYNKDILESFLLEISIEATQKCDPYHKGYLLDFIEDVAEQKGTGRWTAASAIERAIPVTTVTEAVFARVISSTQKERFTLHKKYKKLSPKQKPRIPLSRMKRIAKDSLITGIIITYAQCIDLLQKTSKEEAWNIDIGEVMRIWQGGCIIRSNFLTVLEKIYRRSDKPLLASKVIQTLLEKHGNSLRTFICHNASQGVPSPVFQASLSYLDSMTQRRGAANFIQALRDNFGAHTYKRIDKKGTFHTQW